MKNKLNTFIIFSIIAMSCYSCVTAKLYDKVNKENEILKSKNIQLEEENHKWNQEAKEYRTRYDISLDIIDSLKRILELARAEQKIMNQNHEMLKESYDALLNSNNKLLSENARKNRTLLEDLEKKESLIKKKEYSLSELNKNLEEREKRINELQGLIREKEATLTDLKDKLKMALSGFENKGLAIEQKNGKIYVLLDNKLLFESGSYAVQGEGIQAINALGDVLSKHSDISMMIEGHTDDVPYKGDSHIKDNWDLSVIRATSVVKLLLKNKNIDEKQIIPSGRGEVMPKFSNDSVENRAKNRRIEIIITPDYSKIQSLLEDEN